MITPNYSPSHYSYPLNPHKMEEFADHPRSDIATGTLLQLDTLCGPLKIFISQLFAIIP